MVLNNEHLTDYLQLQKSNIIPFKYKMILLENKYIYDFSTSIKAFI